MKDLKAFLEKYKTEDGYDYEAAEQAINDDINNIVAKNKPSEETLLEKAQQKLIEGLGVDASSLDDLKTYIKKMGGNTDEIKEQNLKLEKEYKQLQQEHQQTLDNYNKIQSEYTTKQQLDKVKSLGLKSDDEVEFHHFKVSKLVSEDKDFDTALNEYKEQHADLFKDKTISTNKRFRSPSDDGEGDMDITAAALKRLKK